MKKITLIIALILIIVSTKSQIPIATIQENPNNYIDSVVTIEGVIMIGADVLVDDYLKAYIQDESGKGLNIWDSELTDAYKNDIVRENKIMMQGTIIDYYDNLEIIPINYTIEDTTIIDDLIIDMEINTALNWQENEGTFIKTSGTIIDKWTNSGGHKARLQKDNDTIIVFVFEHTEIPFNVWDIGDNVTIKCAISVFYENSELLPGYIEDIEITTSLTEDIIFSDDNFMIFPNPVESSTFIEYNLHQTSNITLRIVDLSGREILTLINEIQQQGKQSEIFDASHLKPGVYFCTLKTNQGVQTRKIVKL